MARGTATMGPTIETGMSRAIGGAIGLFGLWALSGGCAEATTAAPVDSGAGAADRQRGGEVVGDSESSGDGDADAQTDPFAGAPPRVCHAAGGWDGKSALFVDASAEFGLDGPQRPLGIRVSALDLDGDHLPEVLVRRNVVGVRSDPKDPALRHVVLLRNTVDAKGQRKLVDDTVASGLLQTRGGAGGRPCQIAIGGDVDNDGDVDVFCGMYLVADKPGDPLDHSEWLANDGSGVFTLLGKTSPLGAAARRALTSATLVDHDRDGRLDLWLGYSTWGQAATADLLFAGDGDGGFVDVSASEGLSTVAPTQKSLADGTAHRNTWGTGACDFNDDGHPDLYTTSYGRYFNGLWLGGGVGGGSRYSDVMFASGFSRDDDDDWRSNWNAQCYCQENPKASDCDTCPTPQVNCPQLKAAFGGQYRWNHATDRQPWRLGGTTAGLQCADLDRDGRLDAVQWNIVHSDVGPSSDPTHIMRNKGGEVPVFAHIPPAESGLQRSWPSLSWNEGDISGAVADLDLDGRLDLVIASSDYPGTRLFVWLQQPTGAFAALPSSAAPEHPRAAGLSVVDLDGDGDLDLVVGSSRARCGGESGADCPPDERVRIWRNTLRHGEGGRGNWLAIALDGRAADGGSPDSGGETNASAIGARVEVVAGGVTQIQEVGGGYGHFGQQNGLTLHFGLGDACDVERVRVRWPNAAATVQEVPAVRANQLVRLRRGAQPAYPWAPGP